MKKNFFPKRMLSAMLLSSMTILSANAQRLLAEDEEPKASYPFSEGIGIREAVTLPENLTGKGVLVAILDTGIQFDHVNFRDPSTMKTRIRVAVANTGRKETNVEEEILQLPHGIDEEHGSHTTGIAAGSYAADGWQGIATEADLCLMEGASAYTVSALKRAFAVADSLDMPLVVNMSFDENSKFTGYNPVNLLCEKLTENGNRPGRIIVTSVGNSGDIVFHSESRIGPDGKAVFSLKPFLVTQNHDDLQLSFSFTSLKENELQFRLFLYDKVAKKEVSEGMTDTHGNPMDIASLVDYVFPTEYEDDPFTEYFFVTEDCVLLPDKNIIPCVEITGPAGAELKLMTLLESIDDEHFTEVKKVEGYAASFALTPAVISVGYSNTHVPGHTYVNHRSSWGVNKYGEKIPDVVAPGTGIISSNISDLLPSKRNENHGSRDVVMPDGTTQTFWWRTMNGSSMAAPVISGIAALMLQYDPTLTVNRLRELLHRTNDWTADCDNAPHGPAQAGHGLLNSKALFDALMGGTAIDKVDDATAGPSAIYDLFGRRLQQAPAQGTFIVNGKVIMK